MLERLLPASFTEARHERMGEFGGLEDVSAFTGSLQRAIGTPYLFFFNSLFGATFRVMRDVQRVIRQEAVQEGLFNVSPCGLEWLTARARVELRFLSLPHIHCAYVFQEALCHALRFVESAQGGSAGGD